jgi:hypothetical protein
MLPDEFEKQFAELDPARGLAPLSDADAVAHAAMNAEAPQLARNSHKGAWLTGAAAAVVAVVALNVSQPAPLPTLSVTSGGLGGYSTSAKSLAPGFSAPNLDTSLSQGDFAMGDMMRISNWKFVAGESLSTSDALRATYRVVALDNTETMMRKIAASVGIYDLVQDQGYWTDSSTHTFSGWLDSVSGGSISYWNQENDPWANCYVSDTVTKDATSGSSDGSKPEVCEAKIAKNLPNYDASVKVALKYLSKWGLSAENVSWELLYTNEYSIGINGTVKINGQNSPIAYSFTFVDDTALYSFSVNLGKIEYLGDYDVIGSADAIARAQKLQDGAILDSDIEQTEFTVTKIRSTMMSLYSNEGTMLWIPAFEIIGHMGDDTGEMTGAIIPAIVDSQLDLSHYTGAWGSMYSMDDTATMMR